MGVARICGATVLVPSYPAYHFIFFLVVASFHFMHVFQIHSYSIAALQVVCAAMWVSGRACCNLLRVLLMFLPGRDLQGPDPVPLQLRHRNSKMSLVLQYLCSTFHPQQLL